MTSNTSIANWLNKIRLNLQKEITNLKNMREKALKWWNSLTFEEKWQNLVQNKTWIKGYPDRDINSLTGSEIELIYVNRTV